MGSYKSLPLQGEVHSFSGEGVGRGSIGLALIECVADNTARWRQFMARPRVLVTRQIFPEWLGSVDISS